MHTVHEEKTAVQFDRWSRWYDATLGRFYFRNLYDESIRRAQSFWRPGEFSEPVIVDLACGTGAFLARARRSFPAAQLHGIDISSRMLDCARSRHDSDERFYWHRASARSLPLPSHSVHLLFCLDAFHHFDEPKTVVREISRVLHPRGVMMLLDPAVETFMQKCIFHTLGPVVDHPYQYYSIQSITALFSAVGCSVRHAGFYRWNNIFVIRHKNSVV